MLAAKTGLEPERCASLVELTDGLPRQIELLGEAVGFLGVDAVEALEHGAFPTMETAIEGLWADLTDVQRTVLSGVSVFEKSFDLSAAAQIHRETLEARKRVLGEEHPDALLPLL